MLGSFWVSAPYNDLRNASSASSSTAESWLVSPMKPAVDHRSTSRRVSARPSCRYGAVAAIRVSVGREPTR